MYGGCFLEQKGRGCRTTFLLRLHSAPLRRAWVEQQDTPQSPTAGGAAVEGGGGGPGGAAAPAAAAGAAALSSPAPAADNFDGELPSLGKNEPKIKGMLKEFLEVTKDPAEFALSLQEMKLPDDPVRGAWWRR